MKIVECEDKNKVPFGSLNLGDVFKYDNLTCIKMEKSKTPLGVDINAVNLYNGWTVAFNMGDRVIPFPNAELRV